MPPREKLTRNSTLMYLAMSGGNRSESASFAGVSRSTFQRTMRRNGIAAPREQWKLSPVDVIAARKLAESGVALTDIAVSFNVHRHTIERAVRHETFKQIRD